MIRQDLRYGLRWLRANPGFTISALVVLALGIGATTATFCVVHSVALRPLALEEPGRLVRIWSNQIQGNVPFFSVSLADFEDWRTQTRTLSGMAAYNAQRAMVVKVDSDREVVLASAVSGDLFPLLGVRPLHGRWIERAESQPGGEHVVVIAYGVWQRLFGGRADAIGKPIFIDDQPSTIVGIMPADFTIPNNPAEVWLPLQAPIDQNERGSRFLRVIGRMRPGADVEDVRVELTRIAGELGARYPASNRGWRVSILPLEDTVVSPELRRALFVLVGAVLFVLIVACANVAGLLLSRAATRRREMAVRTALGAPRRALVRQMLAEGVVLAAGSGLAGVLIAMWSVDGLARIAVDTLPRANEIAFRPAVAAVAIAATAATAVLFALIPALDISRFTLASLRARDSSGDRRESRSRDALVLGEIALAVVLLIGAGLLTRSFVRLQVRDLGFDSDRLLVMQFAAPDDASAVTRREATHAALLTRLAAVPGVEGVAGVSHAPFAGRNPGNVFRIVGRPIAPGDTPPNTDYRVVTPGYLRAMRIAVVRGRDLTESDGPNAPAALISESTARRYWPDSDPLGSQIEFGRWTLTIVGIAKDARYAAIDAPTDALRPMTYVPHRLMPATPLEIIVRTRTPPESLAGSLRAAASAAAPEVPIARVGVMADMLADARGAHRFYTTVLAGFAWMALVLAAAGLWGLIAYGVTRRSREIGIRVALGARPGDVLRMAVARGVTVAVAGLAVGIGAAVLAARVLERLLIGVPPTDIVTFTTIPAVFLFVATIASLLPARRALRIDPAEALRLE